MTVIRRSTRVLLTTSKSLLSYNHDHNEITYHDDNHDYNDNHDQNDNQEKIMKIVWTDDPRECFQQPQNPCRDQF